MIDRRRFLGALGAAGVGLLLPPRAARAIGDRTRFRLAQVVYAGGAWAPRPSGVRRLAWELDKRTSVDVQSEPAEVRLGDPALHRHPFLYLAGDRDFPPFPDHEVERLEHHLSVGGFLLIDGAEGRLGSSFDRAVRRLLARMYPRQPLARLPADHVVFKSFYLIGAPVGRVAAVPYLEGIERDGRLVALYTQNDLGGAWARDNFGHWEHDVYPGGEGQREMAFRLGINIALYALCLDYKADQVHIPFILKRRRWRADGEGP